MQQEHYEEKLKIFKMEKLQRQEDIDKVTEIERQIKDRILSTNREINFLQRAIIEKHKNRTMFSSSFN